MMDAEIARNTLDVVRITPIYAALLAAIFLYLSARVIGARGGAKVTLGDGGDPALLTRICGHANFAEYAPFALVLLLLAELSGLPAIFLHVSGASLVAARAMQAAAFSGDAPVMGLRVAGVLATFFVIGALALWLLVAAVA